MFLIPPSSVIYLYLFANMKNIPLTLFVHKFINMNKKITSVNFSSCVLIFSLLISKISMSQNVGIGTAAPLDKLHVIGNIRSSTLSGVGNRMVLADPNGTLIISTAPGTVNPGWTIIGNAGTAAAANFIGTTDANDW